MRDPTRDTVYAHDRIAALSLLIAAETGTRLTALLADQVALEFREHAQSVQDEAEQAIAKLKAQLARIDSLAAVYGSTGTSDLTHLDDHVARTRNVINRWMNVTTAAGQSLDIPLRALARLNQARAPARKGKDSMKDCVVIETYLDVTRALRTAGFISPIVFVSSNVTDFAEANRSSLKPDLAAEFATLQMEYAPNLAKAKYLLGL